MSLNLYPKEFGSKEEFNAFIEAQLTKALDVYYYGITMEPSEKDLLRAYGRICVGLGMAVQTKSRAPMVKLWDALLLGVKKQIVDTRVAYALKKIMKGSDDPA